jgi:hypothetical protein
MTQESRPMFDEVPPQPSYQEVEAKVLEFWKEKDVFKRSEAKDGPGFVFCERSARHASRIGSSVQGFVPALQEHEGLQSLAQGWLGYARVAG